MSVNFNLIEGDYVDFDEIEEDFTEDYLHNLELTNINIQKKYELTYSEFKELTQIVKKKHNLTRRPVKPKQGKYYYYNQGKWAIKKKIKCKQIYIGRVPTEEIAQKIVELCKQEKWNISRCKTICKNYKEFI